jgi:transcriptional regulator with XRE-family HTH domain
MDEPNNAALGAMLRRYRVAADLSQEALAAHAGVSVRTISNLERGVLHRPRNETLRLLAQALGLTADEREAFLSAARRSHRPPGAQSHDASAATAFASSASSLVIPPTPLIGREYEIAAIVTLMRERATRLLTLVGPGGVGKTHLALETAQALTATFRDGACFVALASLRDPDLVPAAIIAALGLLGTNSAPFVDVLHTYLRDKQMLLLLDNYEHLTHAAPLVADLLAMCPHLVVLATSRTSLRLRGEHEYVVQPLALPTHDDLLSVATLERVAAVRLFVTRVQQVRPGFALTVLC